MHWSCWSKLPAIVLACCLMAGSGTSSASDRSALVISSTVPGDLFLYQPQQLDELVQRLTASGANTVTVTIAWRGVEAQSGQFDFSRYTVGLDRLIAAGFKLLLVLDSSAREVMSASGVSTRQPAVPDWLVMNYATSFAVDVSGAQGFNLDYHDKKHLAVLKRFYQQSLTFFSQRYGKKITAVAPGITHELEVKYPQYSYRWQSYSETAQLAFSSWLGDLDKQPAPLPAMQYGNSLMRHLPTEEPLFVDLMRFREAALSYYVCRLSRLIRSQGIPAAGYFGQPLSSHDGIYATGVIEQLVDCFDEIVIDYNFYDGWGLERKPMIPALIANYALNLGYNRVIAGLYFERFPATEDYLPLAGKTLAALQKLPIAGLELGNVHDEKLPSFAQLLSKFKDQTEPQEKTNKPKARIGLVASKWTFYLWIGEHSNERNIIQDALLASYSQLQQTAGFTVHVLGERALLEQDLSQYDMLVIPHQTTVSASALTAISQYHKNGGRLVQDLRFDAFSATGKPRGQWQNELFSIAGIRWCNNTRHFTYKGKAVYLPPQKELYFDCATMLPRPEGRVLMPSKKEPAIGLLLRGTRTLVFGFIPQLIVDKQQQEFWSWLYLDAINDLLNDKLL